MTESAGEQPGAQVPSGGAAPVNATALFAEAASKSGLMWVEVPGDRAWPFWHAWAQERSWKEG